MAGRIPQTFIDDVVARSDIVEVIGARVPLKKAGREYKACCPFHHEKSPSFTVSASKQFYHCFGCGEHGTVIGFLMKYEKLAFQDAVADLAQRAGLELPQEALSREPSAGADAYSTLAQASRFYEQTLADSPRAGEYVAMRGINAATSARFALGYAPDSWNALLTRMGSSPDGRRQLQQSGLIIERDGGSGFYDRFRDRLMFPIRDSRGRTFAFGGRIIGEGTPKYLNSPETPIFHKGQELYGLYEVRQAHSTLQRLMVVEGYMDVVRLYQAGITYAVATLGTATTQEHLNKLFRLTSEVVFCFDGDRAGRQAAWRALENALPLAQDGREMKFMFLPQDEDPDTLVAKIHAEGFEALVKDALPLSEYLVEHLKEQVGDLSHVDSRARLKALAQPLFLRMPDGVYRELLADRLAADIRIPAAKLKELMRPANAPAASRTAGGRPENPEPRTRLRSRMSVGRGNLLTQAILLVLHHPSAARAVKEPEVLNSVDRPGIGVLKELLEQAQGAANPNTAVLLERWRGRPEYDRLAELAQTDGLMTDPGRAAKELLMAVEKLIKEAGPDRRLEELIKKDQEMGLNLEEKDELRSLLQVRGGGKKPH